MTKRVSQYVGRCGSELAIVASVIRAAPLSVMADAVAADLAGGKIPPRDGERGRELCLRCLRPASVCWCAELAPVTAATHVVFLQHPREGRVAIGTCRMAHLALAGSELHRGVCFERSPRVRALAADTSGDVAVLYPGDGACEPSALARTPRTLIVLDGTWRQARAMWRDNPSLHRLPRIGFMPEAPGNYRIRREPAPHCLATVEALADPVEKRARRQEPALADER